MNLDKAKKGQILRIANIPDSQVRSQAIRFGIAVGEIVICEEIIPAGPVILKKNKQEIALGRRLAQSIAIEIVK